MDDPTSGGGNYEAFSELFDWLKTLFTLLPRVGRIEMAAKARKTSFCTLLMDTSISSVVAHSLRIFLRIGRNPLGSQRGL